VSVKVRLVGDLRRFVEHEAIEIEGGGLTLAAALDELRRRYPQLGAELFDDQGRMHYALVLTTNGRRATWPDDKDRLIEDGCELMLTRFHCGG